MDLNRGHPSRVLECMYLSAGNQWDSQFCPRLQGSRPSSFPGCPLKGTDCRLQPSLHGGKPYGQGYIRGVKPGVLSGLGLNLGLSSIQKAEDRDLETLWLEHFPHLLLEFHPGLKERASCYQEPSSSLGRASCGTSSLELGTMTILTGRDPESALEFFPPKMGLSHSRL